MEEKTHGQKARRSEGKGTHIQLVCFRSDTARNLTCVMAFSPHINLKIILSHLIHVVKMF